MAIRSPDAETLLRRQHAIHDLRVNMMLDSGDALWDVLMCAENIAAHQWLNARDREQALRTASAEMGA